MAIKQYSLKKDGKTYLAPCFQVKEFACRASDTILIDDELVVLLQCIREHFGAKVYITSGYRTAAHNRAVGGAVYSQHQYGRAADIRVSGVPVEQLAAYAETCCPAPAASAATRKRLCPCGCAQSKKPVGRVKAVNGMETILSAVIAGAVTLIGVLIANSRSQAVTDTKLEELTREVREHNNFARRVPILEEQMKVANHRIADLEADEHERERT